nr:MAG TPA: hypothetical protein [Caudoviricetes sp.]
MRYPTPWLPPEEESSAADPTGRNSRLYPNRNTAITRHPEILKVLAAHLLAAGCSDRR